MLSVVLCILLTTCLAVVSMWFYVWKVRVAKHLASMTFRAGVAEKALDDQGMLANEVAHELKNPVTAIVCAAQTLEMLLDATLDGSQRSALRHIKEHGEYVLKLMQDFIDVTRGACGHVKSCKQTIQAGEVARSVVGILNPIAMKKKVSVEVRTTEDDPWVSVDPKHLKQILFNVVHNAVKFTPDGGSVIVSVSRAPEWRDESTLPVCISVKDSGVGISADRLETIFDARANFRGLSGNSNDGCGLGLPLTKTLIDLEGGEIQIRSAAGAGTEVTILFEAVESQGVDAAIPAESEACRLPLAGQRVLVVEDDASLRDAVSGLIRALGGVVDGVGEAVQALEAVQKTPYSAVVIDEYVGGFTANDVAHLIKKEPGAKETRIVFTSASAAQEDANEAQVVGETLRKPFDSEGLISSLLQR